MTKLAAVLLALAAAARAASGLSTRMADVRVQGLEPGKRYDLKAQGIRYAVTNRGDEAATIAVEPVAVSTKSALSGYEPGDAAWVSVLPSSQTAAPGATIESGLVVTVPDDPALAGRKFQVNLWSHTIDGAIAVGVLSRLRLEFAPAKKPAQGWEP